MAPFYRALTLSERQSKMSSVKREFLIIVVTSGPPLLGGTGEWPMSH